jgi:hypothetical protein
MSSRYSLALQIWSSLALGAFLIAYLSSGRNVFRFTIVFAVSFLFLTLLFFGSVRLLRVWRESGELHKRVAKELAAARALTEGEAQERAMTLLLDANLYPIVENHASGNSLHSLGPVLRQFFSRFEEVVEIKGETSLDRSAIGPSTLREGFIKIGTDIEHAEIVARSKKDVIYVIDGTEPEDPPVEEGFPTIYHYLVAGHWAESNAGGKEGG